MLISFRERQGKEFQGNLATSSGIFFLFYAFYKFFSMLYYNYGENLIYRTLDRIFLVVGVVIFIFILIKILFKQIFKTKIYRQIYIALIFGSMIPFVTLYFLFSNLEVLLLLLIFFFPLIGILIYYTTKWIVSLGRNVNSYLKFSIIGIVLFIGGASSVRIVEYLPMFLNFLIFFNSIEIAGLFCIIYGVLGLPKLSEFNWKMKLIDLYIIKTEGICLFEYSFKIDVEIDKHLISGGITSMVNFIKEMTKSEKKLSTIKQGEKNIIVEYGNRVIVAILAEEDLEIMHLKAQQLIKEFEIFFKDILDSWNGELEFFKPAKVLIEKIFLS
ncbi:MAG: hypothetical protein ACTSVY_16780 [Candidatus Helarchaeota archaeon]